MVDSEVGEDGLIWNIYKLSELDIKERCKELKISSKKLTTDQKHGIAKAYQRGVEESLWNWEEILEEAIKTVVEK